MPREPINGGWWQVLKTAITDWQQDKAPLLAAALAFYTLFSVAPLLLIVTVILSQIFGEQAVTGQLFQELQGFLGNDGAQLVQDMVIRARAYGSGVTASIVGIVTLVVGATGVFAQLKDALNTIWTVPPSKTPGWLATIQERVLSFAMVLCIGFLLLVSLIINAALAAAQAWAGDLIPGPDAVVHMANSVVSLFVTAVLFALLFKYLPDVKVAWKNVWLGALVTASLFTVGKFLFGLYLGSGTIGTTYGAAGSVVIILLWAYYASMIFLLGAEFTQAHSRCRKCDEKRNSPP
jgi:membrane protein